MTDMKVDYVDHMGTDLSVVNAAKVSFDKASEWLKVDCGHSDCGPECAGHTNRLSPRDQKLITFLARGMETKDWNSLCVRLADTHHLSGIEDLLPGIRAMPTHWSPFAHTAISLRIKAPIFVARQLQKHVVGFNWNEVSRRYVDSAPEFYEPEGWRKRADSVKQGSSTDLVEINSWITQWVTDYHWKALEAYEGLLREGVCPEQARMVLPQSMMTEWIWTGNVYGFSRVCRQRLDPHAQVETGIIARLISDKIRPLFPVSWEALTE